MNKDQLREYLRANLFDGQEGGQFTAPTSTWLTELVDVVYDLRPLDDEERAIVHWLAVLVKAQATSERNAANRLYAAYNDRNFVHSNLQMARDKIAKCDRIIAVLDSED